MRLSKFIKSIKPGKYETPTNAALIAVVLFLGWLNYAVAWENMPVKDTVWALTPPLIAILMALVTREVYREEMGRANVAPMVIDIVTVDRHHPLAVESAEEHGVAVVGRCDGIGLLNPGAIERSAFAVGYALSVVLIDP